MRSLWKASALAVAASTYMIGVAQAAELLGNPGFEAGSTTVTNCTGAGSTAPSISGQLALNWESNNCWMNKPTSTVAFAMEAGRLGGSSQAFTTNSPTGDAQLASWVWLTPGQRYTTSIWLKADRATEVVLQLRAWGAPYTAYGSAVAKVGTTWQKFTFDGVAPNVVNQIGGGLFVSPTGVAKVWMDDASVTSVADSTQGLQDRTTALPATYFGMHVHRDPKWPAVGKTMRAERFWDAEGVQWPDVYPSNGTTANWTKFDARVSRAIANGAEIVMTLGGNVPGWATSDPTGAKGCNFYAAGSSTFPSSDQVWQDWVRAVGTRAKGKIRNWEIWNEPYQCSAITSDLPRLAKMAADARAILKQIDPLNVVLSPTFDLGDKTYLERYLQAAKAAYPNGEAYGDVLSVHAYDNFIGAYLDDRVTKDFSRSSSVETMFDQEHLVLNMKQVLARYGLSGKSIWNTEAGYLKAATASGTANDAAGAPFVARHYLLGWAAGLDRSFYYAWDQRGLVVAGSREATEGSNNYVPTAVAGAFQQVAQWTSGAITSKPDTSTGVYVMKLKRGLTTSIIAWNPSASTTLTYAPPAKLTRRTDLSGAVSIVSGAMTMTGSPVLFTAPPTTVTLTSSNQAVWQGWNANVKLTATLSGGSSPSGYVQFQIDGANLGSPVILSGGQAILNTTAIDDYNIAKHVLTAVYQGDEFNASNASGGTSISVCSLLGACP